MTLTAEDQIKDAVTQNDVVLFMKGTKMMPQCGLSSISLLSRATI